MTCCAGRLIPLTREVFAISGPRSCKPGRYLVGPEEIICLLSVLTETLA
jgi:hypothetical protein